MSHSAHSDVTPVFISDENAADPDRLVTAARPDTSATMAATTFAGGGARNVTVTTSGTGDNAKTCTITGTDVFGNAMTEVITSTGSAEAVAGTKLFLTTGVVNHYDGTPEDGSILFKSRTIGTDNATVSHSVPGEGALFKDGMTVQYTVATIDMMTFFYA